MEIFKKINLSNPFTFWRYLVLSFALGLIIVFVGQTIFMFVISGDSLSPAPVLPEEQRVGLDPKKAALLLEELEARPARLLNVLATSTVSTSSLFVDPSL